MKIITIIPARGGSKGILRKNIRILGGKPLIAHSILDAQEAESVDKVYVSTDDPEIAAVAHNYGAEVIQRPAEFATDIASSESALIHALGEIEKAGINPEIVVFLQCTSPLRSGSDIDSAIEQMRSENADSLLSVSPTHRFLWHKVNGTNKSINYDYRHRQRRQDMNPQYMENGSIYIFKPWVLKTFNNRLGGKISLFVMSEKQNFEIDSLPDFHLIELLMSQKK